MTNEEKQKLNENINGVWTKMKEALEEQGKEIKKYGEAKGETLEKLEKLENRLDELETKSNRPAKSTKDKNSEPEADSWVKAFDKWLRKGMENLSPEEAKTMTA